MVDLLNEYASNSPHISAETIDPDTQKDRFNKLVEEVTNRYGGEVKGYKAVLAGLKDQDAAVSKFATAEAELYKALPIDAIQDEELHQTALAGFLTVVSIPSQIKDMEEAIDGYTSQQIPSYKDAVDQARATYTNIGQLLDVFSHNAMSLAVTKGIPKEFLAYAGPATKRVAEAQKIVEGVLAQVGQLKDITQINEFRDQLRTKSILVMTNDGYRILSYDQVWRMPQSTPYVLAPTASQARMTFAGEQQITMAIAALTGGPRRLVVFTRPGADPLVTSQGYGQAAPFGAVAQRLRDDNFEVMDKDLSGQWASRQQEQENPNPTPEPTDEQMKTAIWVVLRTDRDAANGGFGINQMLAKHLHDGGSALVLLWPRCDNMDDVLAPFGIHAQTDYIVVHELAERAAQRTLDPLQTAMQQLQIALSFNEYGNHPLARPLDGLAFLTANVCPITTIQADGAISTPLMPVPLTPHAWATSNVEGAYPVSSNREREFR